jgi:hypothetical protein
MASLLTALGEIEPKIHVPTFFKPKVVSKRPDSAVKKKLTQLDHFDRYLRLIKYNNETWLRRRGKTKYSGFTSSQRQQVKQLFHELDSDSSGGLTVDELFDPLLALNLVHSKADVRALFRCPANDPNPVVDLEDFQAGLEAEKTAGSEADKMITDFIKPSPLSYRIRISGLRRKVMLQAYSPDLHTPPETAKHAFKLFAEERNTPHPTVEKADILIKKKLTRLANCSTPRSTLRSTLHTPVSTSRINRSLSRQTYRDSSPRPTVSGLTSPSLISSK